MSLVLILVFGVAAAINLAWVAFFIWNHLYLRAQERGLAEPERWPSVDILIPARDEERNIARCVESLLKQDYPGDWHITVCDDESSDRTLEIIRQFERDNLGRFTAIRGADDPLPPRWCGKCFATARMGERATREWLLFFDADTFFEPGMLREVMRRALVPVKGKPLGLLGGCPTVERVSLSEKIFVAIIPVMFNLSPLAIALRQHFLPPIPGFFHLWPREAYEKTRGYRAVWDKVLDDMEMARVVLNHGYQLKLIDPSRWMGLRMYRSAREVWWGLHKSVGYLMFKSMPLALFSGLGIFWAGVIPWLAPLVWLWRGWGPETWVALGALGMSVVFRVLDWLRNGGPWWAIVFQPVLGAFLSSVLVHATWSLASGRGVVWKDRRYDCRDETRPSQPQEVQVPLPEKVQV